MDKSDLPDHHLEAMARAHYASLASFMVDGSYTWEAQSEPEQAACIEAMRAALKSLPTPPGEGPSRESVARIIDPQAMSPGAVTSTGKPFAGSVRESDALRAADAILALFPPARPDGWRPPTEADQDGKPFIGWNGHVRQWVRWMEGAWRSSETAAPWVPTLIFDLPIPPQEETGRDDVCTDCGGTGTTYQTERPCACQVPPHEGGGKHD